VIFSSGQDGLHVDHVDGRESGAVSRVEPRKIGYRRFHWVNYFHIRFEYSRGVDYERHRQARDIAVLMSLGARREQVARIFFLQGLVVGLIGTTIVS